MKTKTLLNLIVATFQVIVFLFWEHYAIKNDDNGLVALLSLFILAMIILLFLISLIHFFKYRYQQETNRRVARMFTIWTIIVISEFVYVFFGVGLFRFYYWFMSTFIPGL